MGDEMVKRKEMHNQALKRRQLKIFVVIMAVLIFSGWLYWLISGRLFGGNQSAKINFWQEFKDSSLDIYDNYSITRERLKKGVGSLPAAGSIQDEIIQKLNEKIQEEKGTSTPTSTINNNLDINGSTEKK